MRRRSPRYCSPPRRSSRISRRRSRRPRRQCRTATCISEEGDPPLMRTAIGLIGLGLIGGVVPTGLQGITYAVQVLAGTAGALTALVICCLASAVAIRRQTPPVTLRCGSSLRPGSSRDPGHFTVRRPLGAQGAELGQVPGGSPAGGMSHDEDILAFVAWEFALVMPTGRQPRRQAIHWVRQWDRRNFTL